jgi:hypothetical protein
MCAARRKFEFLQFPDAERGNLLLNRCCGSGLPPVAVVNPLLDGRAPL